MIEVHDLTKKYGELNAIYKIELKLEPGDVFGFIGPNGAGKTTTMRILATLLNPTWGEAYVGGYSIYTKPREIRRIIGYMPDFFGVYDDMKVIEYLEFFAAAYRIQGDRPGARSATRSLNWSTWATSARRFVTSLSRGMTQRLGLARVLLHDPQGPDPRRAGQRPGPAGRRIEIRGLLKELRKMGKTIMVSSHILPELADICNKVGIIEKGELIHNAEVAEVMRRVRQQTVLRIKVAENPDAAASLLERSPMVETIETSESVLRVTLTPGDHDYSQLATQLVQEGHRLLHLGRSKSTWRRHLWR